MNHASNKQAAWMLCAVCTAPINCAFKDRLLKDVRLSQLLYYTAVWNKLPANWFYFLIKQENRRGLLLCMLNDVNEGGFYAEKQIKSQSDENGSLACALPRQLIKQQENCDISKGQMHLSRSASWSGRWDLQLYIKVGFNICRSRLCLFVPDLYIFGIERK